MKKLLLHKNEILKLFQQTREKGLTVVPLKMYFVNGLVKVELGLCRGKKNYDKREAEAKRDACRKIDKAIKASRNR